MGEGAEPAEELLLLGVQQLVAPRDGVAQGLLPLCHIARSARQYVQALTPSRQQRLGRKQFHACRRQFESQWQSIQTHTDLRHNRCVGAGQLEVRFDSLRSTHEQCHRLVLPERCQIGQMVRIRQGERRHEELMLGSYVQHHPAGDDYLEMWAGGKEIRHVRSRADYLLEIVQEQQQLLLLQFVLQAFQERLTTHLANAEGLGDGCNDQRGIAHWRQIDEIEAIGEQVAQLRCHLQGQARFTRSAWTRQRQQAYIFTMQELYDGGDFLLPSDERCGLNRQMVGIGTEGLERWKIDGQASDH